ncbi:MAG: tetratricopeptide repeat protein [Candidatus Acidiferrum sp.]
MILELPLCFSRAKSLPSQSTALKFVAVSISLFVCCSFSTAQSVETSEKFQRATEAMRSGRLDEAAEGFSAIVKASPAFAEAHLNLGLAYEEVGKNEAAITSFQKALSIKPRLRGANLFLAIAEYRLNDLDKAVAALRKETSYYPADANAWMWLGAVQLAKSQPEDAAQALDKAAKLDPANVDILYHRGRAHLLISKDSYENMFKADPNSWRVHQVLAQADAESDRHTDAIAEYQAAIKLAPQQPGLHEELGTEYRNAGQIEPADAQYRAELEIDPQNISVRFKLGTLQIERGRPAEAKTLIEAALQQNPAIPDAHYYLGRTEMQLGNDAAAIAEFQEAVNGKVDPDIAQQAFYQLALVYRRQHRMDDAKAALAQFEKLKAQAGEHQQQLYEKKRQNQNANVKESPQQP